MRTQERAEDPCAAGQRAKPGKDVAFAKVTDRAGENGEGHTGKGNGDGGMDGHAKAYGEERDADSGPARAGQAEQCSQKEHGGKNHDNSFFPKRYSRRARHVRFSCVTDFCGTFGYAGKPPALFVWYEYSTLRGQKKARSLRLSQEEPGFSCEGKRFISALPRASPDFFPSW